MPSIAPIPLFLGPVPAPLASSFTKLNRGHVVLAKPYKPDDGRAPYLTAVTYANWTQAEKGLAKTSAAYPEFTFCLYQGTGRPLYVALTTSDF